MARRMLVALVTLFAVTALPAAPAVADEPPEEPEWASVESATIRPGVRITTESGGCTSNFIFYERHVDEEGNVSFDVYIGLAAHCFTQGGSTGTNGCVTPTRPHESPATVEGAAHPATLVYSSWVTMQDLDEENGSACATNDFAIVRLDERDHASVNPTLLYFGGPDGLRTEATSTGDEVYSYGNSSLRQGISELSPKRGISTGTANDGWSHRVYTVTPGIPGDSGSAFVDEDGHAMGVVVTLQIAPFAGSNGVTDLNRALSYLREKTGRDVRLAHGTEPFDDPLLP